ncbi:TPA: hypothetical protein HA270_03130 [Candidatus Woesearchaeota archaeon]|nr:hypothetical protein [Candidatus Woesearchaeota archaeon]
MPDTMKFIYVTIGFFVGIVIAMWGIKTWKNFQIISNIPTSKIRSIAMGLVEIKGKVLPKKESSLASPFTKKPCVWYQYTIEEYRKSGKSSRWVTLKKASAGEKFFCQDDTGCVLIDPRGAKLDVALDAVFNSGFGKDPPQNVMSFLKESKMSFEGFLGINKTMRYREWYLKRGDAIYVLGKAGDNPHVEEGTAINNNEDLMIGKGGSIFIISDKEEKQLLNSMKQNALWGIVSGGILMALCLAGLLLELNVLR